jgi:hypothetical protein
MSDHNAAIRALIEHRFPDATPVIHRTAEPVATGIEALDAVLPDTACLADDSRSGCLMVVQPPS